MQLSSVQALSIVSLTLLFFLLFAGYSALTLQYNLEGLAKNSQYAASEASYLIWTDGSTVYAKNGLTDAIDYSGIDAATVINYAITTTYDRGGGIVFVKSGNYAIRSSIILKSYVTLEGEGWGEQKASTVLRLADNVNDDVIRTLQQKNYHVTIRNLQIEGNIAHQTAGSGIHIYATDRPVIEFVMIKWCFQFGILIEGDSKGCTTIAPLIKNVFVWGCGKEGLFIAATDSFIQNVDVGHDYKQEGTQSALHLFWAHKSVVANSFFWGSKYGILVNQTNSVLVTGCRVDYNRYDGIVLQCASSNIIDGNEIVHNSQYGAGYADGIRLIGSESIPCSNNTISNNFVGEDNNSKQYHRYAINEEGPYCDNNLITGNSVHCQHEERIIWTGANTIVCNNGGYITENSGTATGTSPMYVAHGLSKSPTCVTLGVYGTVPSQTSWSNYNRTHIAIYHNAGEGVAITVTWYAKYKP